MAFLVKLASVSVLVIMTLFTLGFSTAAAQGVKGSGGADLEDSQAKMPDTDTRTGKLAPSSAQLNSVAALSATATWNKFGTPASLFVAGSNLASNVAGDAPTATRTWLRNNAALFKLTPTSVDNLELVGDNVLPGTVSHIVLYRQKFGGLAAAQDGMITLGFVKGSIIYVSSTSAGDQTLAGAVTLTPGAAWLAAAANVGKVLPLSAITNAVNTKDGWTTFSVAGFAQQQQVRLRALPTTSGVARRVYEVNVVNSQGSDVLAYTSFVDAQNSQILVRQNRVDTLDNGLTSFSVAQQTAGVTPVGFSGAFTPPSGCGPVHGPYVVAAGVGSVIVSATATIPTNDIVLKLLRNGVVVATSDVATSPEVVTYSPSGGVPTGNYTVQVCGYGPDPTVPYQAPYSYTGAVSQSAASTSASVTPTVAKWRYFDTNPLLNYTSTDNRVTRCWNLVNPIAIPADCKGVLNNNSSRLPWDVLPTTGTSTQTTIGNNAVSARAWASPLTPAEQYRPVSVNRDYSFPWTNQWYTSQCSPTAFTSLQMVDSDASVTNLFVAHNRMHDWSYTLGFTELTWNAQTYNFGLNTNGEHDPELGNSMAGGLDGGAPSYEGRDNANQIALQDGIPGITNMYLWQPIAGAFYGSCVDGDYDMSVVGHEYTHLISNRMVGGPDSSLTGAQAGAMGESWSDLDALEYMQENGLATMSNSTGYVVGAYVTGNQATGIRNYNNFTAASNPLNYSDVGYDIGGPEVHSDAEIWDAVNHDIRRALMTKYQTKYPTTDAAQQLKCANGSVAVYNCPGNRRWIQIVYSAWLLMQPDVDFLGARDAYLAADKMLALGYGYGASCGGYCWTDNQTELWQAFATRGMGVNALSQSSDDTDPRPSFESATVPNPARVTFNIVAPDENNAAVGAKIYVGNYEARAVPIADTIQSTALVNNAKFVTGTYNFVIQAPGYGLFRYTGVFTNGQSLNLTLAVPTNWASATKGASASNGGGNGTDTNLTSLIDDTENTAWARSDSAKVTDGAGVIVKLGGGAHAVSRVQVSAAVGPDNGSRFTAVRSFEVWTCTASAANANCGDPRYFTRIYVSPYDAFAGVKPRPAQPTLLLKSFTVPTTTATHVMFRVSRNQCTGNSQFQGDQDADPLNNSDCVTSASLPINAPAGRSVSAAEFEVFSR